MVSSAPFCACCLFVHKKNIRSPSLWVGHFVWTHLDVSGLECCRTPTPTHLPYAPPSLISHIHIFIPSHLTLPHIATCTCTALGLEDRSCCERRRNLHLPENQPSPCVAPFSSIYHWLIPSPLRHDMCVVQIIKQKHTPSLGGGTDGSFYTAMHSALPWQGEREILKKNLPAACHLPACLLLLPLHHHTACPAHLTSRLPFSLTCIYMIDLFGLLLSISFNIHNTTFQISTCTHTNLNRHLLPPF